MNNKIITETNENGEAVAVCCVGKRFKTCVIAKDGVYNGCEKKRGDILYLDPEDGISSNERESECSEVAFFASVVGKSLDDSAGQINFLSHMTYVACRYTNAGLVKRICTKFTDLLGEIKVSSGYDADNDRFYAAVSFAEDGDGDITIFSTVSLHEALVKAYIYVEDSALDSMENGED